MRSLLQFTLDLFDAPAAPLEPAANSEEKPPETPVNSAYAATNLIAYAEPAVPAEPLSKVMAALHFKHPQASREALLGNSLVAYAFRRGKRRTIGFTVGADGLQVSAPKWVPLYEVDKAVQEKSGWILQKLHEARDRHARLESARIEWKDGALLPFMGEQVIVVLDPRQAHAGQGESGAGAVLQTEAQALPGVPRHTLHIGLPQHASQQQIRDAVQAWLMRQAKRIFTERLNHFAPQLGVQWKKLSLSSAGTRWGSASADGSIRLNWRLVHLRMSVLDYVVAHELAHLRVMDHSPRFWDTVASVMPNHAALRAELRDDAVPRW